MVVLLDIEWIEDQEETKELTQIAAARMDDKWNVTENFAQIICPSDANHADWDHVAYCGYEKEAFLAACGETEAIEAFRQWLSPDDHICLWSHAAQKTFRKKWSQLFGHGFSSQRVRSVNNVVYQEVQQRGIDAKSFYEAAKIAGSDETLIAHCAKDDVVLMRQIMVHFGITQRMLLGECDLVARRKKWLETSPYAYFYTASSEVFHIHNCPVLLRATDLMGCETYKTAIRYRRPCKCCNPPAPELPQQRETTVAIQPVSAQKTDKDPEELIKVRLFDGSLIHTYRKKIVGCCHNLCHPGKMNKSLLLEHDCIGKQCRFFEKYEEATYWAALKQQQKNKERRKRAVAANREMMRARKDTIRFVGEELQYYLDLCGYDVDVIEIKEERKNIYKVFYVSDKSHADGREYPDFMDTINYMHPDWRLLMRHIRDETGHFVTIDEFYERRRG